MRYSTDQILRLEEPLAQWRQGVKPTGICARDLTTFITNVSNDRWRSHFPRTYNHNWAGFEEVKYQVQMAFIDYLLTPKSSIVRSGPYRVCPLDKEYNSIPFTLTEFKLQFPRVVTVLQANSIGLRLLPPYYNTDHIATCVKTVEYTTLHRVCLLLRKYVVMDNNHSLVGFSRFVTDQLPARTERIQERLNKCIEGAWGLYLSRNIQHINEVPYA